MKARFARVLVVVLGGAVPRGRHLIRVVVETDREPAEVVTAYRTASVEKYWQVHDAD